MNVTEPHPSLTRGFGIFLCSMNHSGVALNMSNMVGLTSSDLSSQSRY
jgi:hypothetical protein